MIITTAAKRRPLSRWRGSTVSPYRTDVLIWFSRCRPSQRVWNWHDPAHVLVGILQAGKPKPFGSFLAV
jgi:hypothetical protein